MADRSRGGCQKLVSTTLPDLSNTFGNVLGYVTLACWALAMACFGERTLRDEPLLSISPPRFSPLCYWHVHAVPPSEVRVFCSRLPPASTIFLRILWGDLCVLAFRAGIHRVGHF